MRRPALNLVVDAIAFVGFVFMTASGVLLRFLLPPGSGHRTSIWGLNRHEWGGIHYLDGCRASGRALGARRDAREVDRAHGSWAATRRLRHPGRAGSRRPGGDPGAGRRIAFQPGRAGRTHTTAGSARLLARARCIRPGRVERVVQFNTGRRHVPVEDVVLQPCAMSGCRKSERRLEEVRTQVRRLWYSNDEPDTTT